jgi:ribosomal protein L7/L12
VADGRIIEAVRDIRGQLGIGLKEAKDVADLIREQEASRGARAP